MKRLFYESRLYDYSTQEDAQKHIEEMRSKGLCAKLQDAVTRSYIYNNGQDGLPFSVEFMKQK